MLWLYVLIGLGAGILSGLFGIGGGLVIVPALILVARMPITTATGTSLGALLLPVGLLGALVYYREGHLDIRISFLVAAGLFLGAGIGARLANSLAPPILQRGLALFLVLVAARLWITARG